jgi:hypothetical protein
VFATSIRWEAFAPRHPHPLSAAIPARALVRGRPSLSRLLLGPAPAVADCRHGSIASSKTGPASALARLGGCGSAGRQNSLGSSARSTASRTWPEGSSRPASSLAPLLGTLRRSTVCTGQAERGQRNRGPAPWPPVYFGDGSCLSGLVEVRGVPGSGPLVSGAAGPPGVVDGTLP